MMRLGAQDWNRTSTSLRMADFESAASTNSATWAGDPPDLFPYPAFGVAILRPPAILSKIRRIYFF